MRMISTERGDEMPTGGNMATVSRFVERAYNGGDQAAVDEFISPDHVLHLSGRPDLIGREGVMEYLAEVRTGFPDVHIDAEDQFGQRDQVAVRWRITGTHEGEYQGIPPTGKHASIGCISIFRLSEGKIVENWISPDMLSLLRQLGVIPEV